MENKRPTQNPEWISLIVEISTRKKKLNEHRLGGDAQSNIQNEQPNPS